MVVGLTARGVEDDLLQPYVWIAGTLLCHLFSATADRSMRGHHRHRRFSRRWLCRPALVLIGRPRSRHARGAAARGRVSPRSTPTKNAKRRSARRRKGERRSHASLPSATGALDGDPRRPRRRCSNVANRRKGTSDRLSDGPSFPTQTSCAAEPSPRSGTNWHPALGCFDMPPGRRKRKSLVPKAPRDNGVP
jgi:hypothetical protein